MSLNVRIVRLMSLVVIVAVTCSAPYVLGRSLLAATCCASCLLVVIIVVASC
jgi:hypothetical protein